MTKYGVGTFTISLDFELYWGVLDVKSLNNYKNNLVGVHSAIPKMLDLFQKFNIHCTWSAVGFLFLKNFKEIIDKQPTSLPTYTNRSISPYLYSERMKSVVDNETLRLHFAPNLIKLIQQTPNQEIGTHTYSHFYSLENGQNLTNFEDDLKKNIEIASKNGISLKSIVFPRNQVNEKYFDVLEKYGIKSYRGPQYGWMYKSKQHTVYSSIIRRGARFLDTFFKLNRSATKIEIYNTKLVNIPASRFFQPFTKRPIWLEKRKINRIKNEMTTAAKKNELYHLWWHPHNFGVNIEENIAQLEEILLHYQELNREGLMVSKNMSEIADEYLQQ